MHTDAIRKTAGALFAALALTATPASALSFNNYDSNNFGGDLLSTLPGDQVYRVLYSIDVGSLAQNDVLVALSEFEVTNDTGVTQRTTAKLILTDSASSTTGTELSEDNDRNITPGMHHQARVKGAIKKFSSAQGANHFVNLLVLATGTLTIPPANGRLQALKITP